MSHHRPSPEIIEIQFVVEPELSGMRVDHFLKKKIERLSRTRIQRIIETQLEGPGGRKMKPHSPVAAGDRLVIRRPARPEPEAPRELPVVWQDASLLVLAKPALLAMHPSAKYHFNTLTAVLGELWPGEKLYTTHRLDRETSGIVVIARSQAVAAQMKTAFERRWVKKRYLALTVGAPAEDVGLIDEPIGLAGAARKVSIKMLPMAVERGGLTAETGWRVLGRRGGYGLLEMSPLTGRQHQIRAHLAARGWPIVGDKLYGGATPAEEAAREEAFMQFMASGWTDELRQLWLLERHALHAFAIEFPHPVTAEPLRLETPLPADLQAFWDGLPPP